jgi:hypothetical protein
MVTTTEFVNEEELLNSILHISPRVNWDTLKLNEVEAFILSRANGVFTIREIISQTDVDTKQAIAIVTDFLNRGILLIEKKLPGTKSDFSLTGLKRLDQKIALKKSQEVKSFENFEIKFPFGSLSEYHFPKVLMYALYSKFSGKIEIENGNQMRIISFESGLVCDVKSIPVVLQECLGRIMLSRGEITYEQYQESLKLMARSHKRQGEILVQMKAATEKKIENALRVQAELKLMDLFSWENGEYKFKQGVKVNRSFPSGIDLISTIYHGVKERTSLERIRKEIKPLALLEYEIVNSNMLSLLKNIANEQDRGILISLEQKKNGKVNDLLSDNSAISYIMVYTLLLPGIIRVKR